MLFTEDNNQSDLIFTYWCKKENYFINNKLKGGRANALSFW